MIDRDLANLANLQTFVKLLSCRSCFWFGKLVLELVLVKIRVLAGSFLGFHTIFHVKKDEDKRKVDILCSF